MIDLKQDFRIRRAEQGDLAALTLLMQRKSFVHRHLGWHPPLAWLGKNPFFVLEGYQGIQAALAFPPDEDGITWLRLFAVAPGLSVPSVWKELWPAAIDWYRDNTSAEFINTLVIQEEMSSILLQSGFEEVNQVVVLIWDVIRAQWPDKVTEYPIRNIQVEDYQQIYKIDQLAFEPIWRNSLSQLEAAHLEAVSATVIEWEGEVVGYQISTTNPQGGHLARLAVNPSYQNRGFATQLLTHLLERFQEFGIVEVTVNTQSKNSVSLDLYSKFGFVLQDEVFPVLQFDARS
ncbi:MAG: GNAT family N-acetyltransferase [Anaerolineales bacterium]|nr:GNAT family N-acetyltransferase [Anaerolineales bacterium]